MSRSTRGGGVNHRSAQTGRFVTERLADRSPSTTVTERRDGGSTHGAHRSAVSGKFVPESYANRHPDTTIRDS